MKANAKNAKAPLTLRAEAQLAGISTKTIQRRRKAAAEKAALAAPAKPVAPVVVTPSVDDLVAQIASLRTMLEARSTPEAANDAELPIAGGRIASPMPTKASSDRRRFILTCAQNNTHVHMGFLASLRVYAAAHDAEILVSRFSYNKNGWGNNKITKDDVELWYDPEIADYVNDESLELAPGLVWCGELDISPTATDPLSGLDSYTRSASAIIPHVKISLRSMATMKHEAARILYTTGTVTQRNYVERKAGQKASFHHVFGALIVEVDIDDAWFVRQLLADDAGHFHDLEHLYTPTGITRSRVEAVTWGDFHEEKADPVVADACFGGPTSILESLRPREQHVHDLADFTARNHHNRNDAYFKATMHAKGLDRVEADLTRCAEKLERIHRDWCQTVVVESNHDQAFRRWLAEADGHQDAPNARYWHFWNYKIFSAIERGEDLFVFEAAVREKMSSEITNVRFLKEDDSWVICSEQSGGIECGLHGHRGPNGSRGSPKSYRQLGVRANTAHTHSCGIVDGIYTAGVSGTLDMGYNCGPSSWSHSHIITYPSGKRTILTQRGSRWRGTPVQASVSRRAA